MGLGYVTANRGACHLNGWSIPEQNNSALIDCLGVCSFATDGFGKNGLRELLSAITGIDWTEDEYKRVGERTFNLERAFNCREGFMRRDDILPDRFFEDPILDGPGKGNLLDRTEFEKMLTQYYQERGWDEQTGKPLASKLESLGLASLVRS
jgi:aldehyde:ferredoxin oxidoreductase